VPLASVALLLRSERGSTPTLASDVPMSWLAVLAGFRPVFLGYRRTFLLRPNFPGVSAGSNPPSVAAFRC